MHERFRITDVHVKDVFNKQYATVWLLWYVYQSSSSSPKRPPPDISMSSSSSSSSSFFSSAAGAASVAAAATGAAAPTPTINKPSTNRYQERQSYQGDPFQQGWRRTQWTSREQWCYQKQRQACPDSPSTNEHFQCETPTVSSTWASAQIRVARAITSSSFSIADMFSKKAMVVVDHLRHCEYFALTPQNLFLHSFTWNQHLIRLLSQFKRKADKSVWRKQHKTGCAFSDSWSSRRSVLVRRRLFKVD